MNENDKQAEPVAMKYYDEHGNDKLEGLLINNSKHVPTIACFDKANTEVLRIQQDGDVIWKGRKIESDVEFKAAMIDLANVMKANMYPAQPVQPDFSDAYQGAREDAEIWKKRALEAEELNRKFIADINGQTFMGEPAQPVQPVEPVGVVNYADFQTADAITNPDAPLRMAIEETAPRSIQRLPKGTKLYTAPPAAAINEQMLSLLKTIDNEFDNFGDPSGIEYKFGLKAAIAEAEKAKGSNHD